LAGGVDWPAAGRGGGASAPVAPAAAAAAAVVCRRDVDVATLASFALIQSQQTRRAPREAT